MRRRPVGPPLDAAVSEPGELTPPNDVRSPGIAHIRGEHGELTAPNDVRSPGIAHIQGEHGERTRDVCDWASGIAQF